jgi:hypothetical protein
MGRLFELVVGFSFISSTLYLLKNYVFQDVTNEKIVLGKFLALCFLTILGSIICNTLLFETSALSQELSSRLISFVLVILAILMGYYIGKFNK